MSGKRRPTKKNLMPGDRVRLIDGRSVVLVDKRDGYFLINEQYKEIRFSDIEYVVSKPRANAFKTYRAF